MYQFWSIKMCVFKSSVKLFIIHSEQSHYVLNILQNILTIVLMTTVNARSINHRPVGRSLEFAVRL